MASAKPLAVLRIAKIKTAASLARRSGHVARTQPVENADPSGRVVWLTTDHDPSDAVNRTIAGLDRPPRKNAVLAVEVIMTASPSAFTKADSPAAFADLAMAWVEQTFGPGRVCSKRPPGHDRHRCSSSPLPDHGWRQLAVDKGDGFIQRVHAAAPLQGGRSQHVMNVRLDAAAGSLS